MAVDIKINGRPDTAEGPTTISAVLGARKIRPEVVLVQHNGERVPSAEFATREIADGDALAIVLQLAGGEDARA